MIKRVGGMIGGCLLVVALGIGGCGSDEMTGGVPKDVGYVPPKMQPNMGTGTGKPILGATEKDKREAKQKAEAAPAPAAPTE